MKCIHHTDDDGLCAAAIVRFYLKDKPEEPSDFIPWTHGMDLVLPENLTKGETWYIVDLALNDVIYEAIIKLIDTGCKVVHIDHHKSGIDYYDNLSDESKEKISDVVKYYDTAVSGSMLTFLYAQMDDDDRKNPGSIDIDFKPNMSKYAFTNKVEPVIGDIPFVVRYINDWDIQAGVLADAVPFHYGFKDEKMKNPYDDIWLRLFTMERFTITPIIQRGSIIAEASDRENERAIKNGFETIIDGVRCFAVNTTAGDCRMFNKMKDEYSVYCKFSYDGKMNKWRYFLVSNGEFDASILATKFGGGGHHGAAGIVTDKIIFDIVK